MLSQTAQYYDTIYLAMKDYGAEAETLPPSFISIVVPQGTGSWMLPVGLGFTFRTSSISFRLRDSILTSNYSPSLANETLMSPCITRT